MAPERVILLDGRQPSGVVCLFRHHSSSKIDESFPSDFSMTGGPRDAWSDKVSGRRSPFYKDSAVLRPSTGPPCGFKTVPDGLRDRRWGQWVDFTWLSSQKWADFTWQPLDTYAIIDSIIKCFMIFLLKFPRRRRPKGGTTKNGWEIGIHKKGGEVCLKKWWPPPCPAP